MPFHLIFDRDMFATQAGASIARVIPQLKEVLPRDERESNTDSSNAESVWDDEFGDEEQLRLTNIFELARPPIPFSFHHILSQINQVFVLRTKFGENSLKASA